VQIDELIQRLLKAAPEAHIGRGPDHPTSPDLTLAQRIATWLAVHPFLNRDAAYVEFLRRYSGVDVLSEYTAENIAKGLDWDLDIPGFAPVGPVSCLDDVGGHVSRFDPTVPHINENKFYSFATVCFRHSGQGTEPSDWAHEEFGFDASAERRWGVYRILDPPEWFCETFTEWLGRAIDSRGRVCEPRHFLSDLLAPAAPEEPKSPPSRLVMAGFYCGLVGTSCTISCFAILGIPLGLLAAILAGIALARRKRGDKGWAVAALIFGILAIALVPLMAKIVGGP
jgi:hypothetical protein